MSQLDRLLSVLDTRSASAKRALNAADTDCRKARRRRSNALRDLESFQEEVKDLEVELLSDIVEKGVTVHEINKIRNELEKAKDRAKYLVLKLNATAQLVDQKEQVVSEARANSVHAEKRLSRIAELRSLDVKRKKKREASKKEDEQADAFLQSYQRG